MARRNSSRVVLGVGGGISAYKSVDLTRRLKERGCEVRVVMTQAATAFVGPLTFQAVSGHPVRTTLLDPAAEAGMGHIELARWADRLLIAPATADLMARLAAGIADDLLTTLALATEAPLSLAPAMNQAMWRHPATQRNLDILRSRGAQILGPAEGGQACGDVGPGRMLEPLEIADIIRPPTGAPLAGARVLLTAGPTREPLDPVRFLGNRSSGKMGFALAEALTDLGARVVLVSGPTALPAPRVAEQVCVETALEMHAAVLSRAADCDLFVATAAVADYRPAEPLGQKIKKDAGELTLRLVRNPDILAEVAARRPPPFTVGFAAETDRVEEYARDKLVRKGLDLIAANHVGGARGGFERDENALTLIWKDGSRELPMRGKTQLARELALLIVERYLERHATPT
ncbi:bifunctional phosphopantothenoylcysteine decarboxylase/phosphopantothenate--cysteine ligase CoaBC [Thiocystis violacea]|uniref:bifunctional phosphopantothenoylcysteine decarboxylase/phosphopantothenate--cysteine ligase CoaBC n=1 Tax=Thiocystis violacea TaxID=13725 RepID=UPI0019071A4E|nr:bifunctional phosphopantothenoylcysteine decarboxylase/phosphopantothenate--cysteine ligase CoaBC [Thiocystis violacea]MBK1718365.1 bifunctional phosphopantothenoylcysteine decarboxylase/phosphopantothenate--cysteine ligase CoaBC [Thiocystis violacea]